MIIINFFLQLIKNPNQVILNLLNLYNYWIYLFLFLIIFSETGLIIFSFLMPFLPGDALLFAIGIISATGKLNIYFIIILLIIAAILGDNLNFWIGKKIGKWIILKRKIFIINIKYIKKAEFLLKKYGKQSIIIARFIPVIRTIIPFLSGVVKIKYNFFLLYSLIGATIWVIFFILSGYLFGQFNWVKINLEKIILLIIVIVNIPLIYQTLIKKKYKKN